MGDVAQLKGDRAHVHNNAVAVTEIGQRLNISGSQQLLSSCWIAANPSPIEVLNIILCELAVLGQSLSFGVCHLRSNHQERAENDNDEKVNEGADLQLERPDVLPHVEDSAGHNAGEHRALREE